ncbi:Clp1-like protein [Rhodotorula diobovata]|uniref:Clp1-like protein n=1 Tax=Rhodotorula diobovata TaxID=5288 RepID=A0A5C5G2I3_9BASI|nr:Clp1-like protein [Rhodotorula diobovata]
MGDPWPGGDGSLVGGLLPPPTAASDGGSLLPSPLPFPPFHLPNGRVRIPVSLPPNPDFLPVQLDELDVDDELALSGATLDFTLSSLHNSAHTLIQASQATGGQDRAPLTTHESPFPLVRCTRPPAPLPLPTHLLELHFLDTGERYRTPVHGLLWALQSPLLPQLCRRFVLPSSTTSSSALLLPLVQFALPCRAAWPLLHRFLYDGSAAQLLNGLLAPPDSVLPHRNFDPRSPTTPTTTTRDAAQPLLDSLVVRLMRVREVWLDAHALELSNRHLWDTLERAYTTLVAELGEAAADLPGCAVPPRAGGGGGGGGGRGEQQADGRGASF